MENGKTKTQKIEQWNEQWNEDDNINKFSYKNIQSNNKNNDKDNDYDKTKTNQRHRYTKFLWFNYLPLNISI